MADETAFEEEMAKAYMDIKSRKDPLAEGIADNKMKEMMPPKAEVDLKVHSLFHPKRITLRLCRKPMAIMIVS
jgi:hypothetical protein